MIKIFDDTVRELYITDDGKLMTKQYDMNALKFGLPTAAYVDAFGYGDLTRSSLIGGGTIARFNHDTLPTLCHYEGSVLGDFWSLDDRLCRPEEIR